MGSVGVEEDAKAAVEAFLQRCAPSGDAAYAELRALLARLHDPATRRQARVFLAALRRRQQSSSDDRQEDFFRRFGFRIQELLLHGNTVAAFRSASAPGNHAHRSFTMTRRTSSSLADRVLVLCRSFTAIILISQSGARSCSAGRSLSTCKW
jgi:methionine S-methyltransferase